MIGEQEYLSLCAALEREATQGGLKRFISSPAFRKEMRERVKSLYEDGWISEADYAACLEMSAR